MADSLRLKAVTAALAGDGLDAMGNAGCALPSAMIAVGEDGVELLWQGHSR